MSASITSSPTLIDSPHNFDDLSPSHRAFHYFDNRPHLDLHIPPAPTSPPPYPESLLYSYQDDQNNFSPSSRSSAYSCTNDDGQLTPRLGTPTDGRSMRTRVTSLTQQRLSAGLQLLYTHIAHGAIHDAVVERFHTPNCHPETHRAIVDDVMSWIQYTPPTSSAATGMGTEAPPTPSTPTYTSATLSFYGPHTRKNSKRNRSASMAPPPSQPEHILWLSGPTTSGKSSLMHTIAERCSNTATSGSTLGVANNQHVLCEPPVPLLAASFFFRHHKTTRNNKSKFVPTLAYQLARNVPGLGDIIGKVIERDVGVLSLGEDTRDGGLHKGLAMQMEKLILEPMAQLAQQQQSTHRSSPLSAHRVVLLEALDECINDEDQIEILSLVRKLSQDRRFVPYFCLVLEAVTYRLILPFAEGSAGKVRHGGSGGRGRGRGAGKDAGDDEDMETDIQMYLQCKFNEICRMWYGLPRNVGWPDPFDDAVDPKDGAIHRLVYNASGKFAYALTVIRFIMRGEGPDRDSMTIADASDPRRLLQLVLQAKFTKSYQHPYAALDALYNVILHDAAERSGFSDSSHLAKAVREIDELLSSGTGVELTLPRLALFFGFDTDADGEGRCLEKALVGGYMDAILEIPLPTQEDLQRAFRISTTAVRRTPAKGGMTIKRAVKFHDRSFVDFIRDPQRAKGLYVSRSQLYTDLAMRYLKSASAQFSLQPDGATNKASSPVQSKSSSRKQGLHLVSSPASSTSSFSATYNEADDDAYPSLPFSAPADISTFRRNHQHYASLHSRHRSSARPFSSPYAIDPDDAATFLSQLHLGKFCSFSVADSPELVKELVQFDVELWLFGIAASLEEPGGSQPPTQHGPHMLSLGSAGPTRPSHRRVMSELPTASNRHSTGALAAVPLETGSVLKEREKEKERKRNEALLKLHGSPHAGSFGTGGSGSTGPENDVDAMYRWVHVECSWSSCTPVCRKWRRAIVRFWQRQGAPQQPTVMDRIYDKFMPRDVKRVKLITSRYRL
ncbi:hypothetical protein DFP72DRAFT_1074969 [Ephemerocybe angulata]|uniref:Nephrocystin 3-like N-terminal domain-containing protein n=1 Tax=Ephemerocybe angulata TaxID=980116 RepID=A0A8H6HJ02_9AGAR|nr:hypothetical protein DFP72DRAFT_1074969 [Tulosesus angulatus]